MSGVNKEPLGSLPISKLLIQQSIPASIGILVMSLNILIDTVFVGQWIGSDAIAAINVVLPVSFFIAALGMSIGIGGSSIISRALGDKNKALAKKTFGNQLSLTLTSTLLFSGLGLFFSNGSLAQGEMKPHAIKVVLILPSFLITRTGSVGLIKL